MHMIYAPTVVSLGHEVREAVETRQALAALIGAPHGLTVRLIVQ